MSENHGGGDFFLLTLYMLLHISLQLYLFFHNIQVEWHCIALLCWCAVKKLLTHSTDVLSLLHSPCRKTRPSTVSPLSWVRHLVMIAADMEQLRSNERWWNIDNLASKVNFTIRIVKLIMYIRPCVCILVILHSVKPHLGYGSITLSLVVML